MKNDWQWLPDRRCKCCNEKGHVHIRVVEDYEGHEDYQYWCKRCSGKWWVDGIDS